MKSQANSLIEYETIGSAPQTVSTREGPCRILFGEFGVASTKPIAGAMTLADFMAEFEADPDIAPRLSDARRALSGVLDQTCTLRGLRLAAGLSQAKLAAGANTTQAYIARIESGTVDPGTDMVARLATALGTDAVRVFAAVSSQRAQHGTSRVG
jgi:DNA-binding XRE family transcriptional regulator